MKLSAKQITISAALLAICIVSIFLKNLSVYATGPIVNACLILATVFVGLPCGIILSVITPIASFFITGSPITAAMPIIVPCIMAGNALLCVGVAVLRKFIKGMPGLTVGMIAGSVVKALFMGVVISMIILPNLMPAPMVEKGLLTIAQTQFSITQLFTSLIGSVYAAILYIPLKQIFSE